MTGGFNRATGGLMETARMSSGIGMEVTRGNAYRGGGGIFNLIEF